MGLNPTAALKHESLGPTPTLQGRQKAQVEPVLTRDQQVLPSQAQSHKDMRDQCYSSPGVVNEQQIPLSHGSTGNSILQLGMWRDGHQLALRRLVPSKDRV